MMATGSSGFSGGSTLFRDVTNSSFDRKSKRLLAAPLRGDEVSLGWTAEDPKEPALLVLVDDCGGKKSSTFSLTLLAIRVLHMSRLT